MTLDFERRIPANDGIHDNVSFNNCTKHSRERKVTIGQLILGTFGAVAFVVLYLIFRLLEE